MLPHIYVFFNLTGQTFEILKGIRNPLAVPSAKKYPIHRHFFNVHESIKFFKRLSIAAPEGFSQSLIKLQQDLSLKILAELEKNQEFFEKPLPKRIAVEWTPVEDGLPGPHTDVLFVTKDGQKYYGYIHERQYSNKTRMVWFPSDQDDSFYEVSDVTHWMHYPELPVEKKAYSEGFSLDIPNVHVVGS